MFEILLEQARRAVELGQGAGADDVIAGVSWKRGLDFEWRAGRLEKVQESTSRRLGIALYVDGRFSNHSTNDLDPERLRSFVEEAVALTRYLEPDPHRLITPPELYEGRSDVDLEQVDPGLADLGREQRIEWCEAIHERASAADFVITAETAVSDGHARAARVSSNGFEGTDESTAIWLGGQVTAADGEKRPEAYRYVGGIHLADLPAAEKVGEELLERVRARLGAGKVPSCKTKLILDPEAGPSFLRRVFGALSAGAIQQKRSYLAESLNEPIASPLFTATDEPLLKRGLSSRHYDGEGIASHPRTIIEEGVLKSFYVDTYYGRKLGWEPNSGSSSNILFQHGSRGLSEILADVDDGIYITNWLGGNANLTTGDFSFGFQGHRVENGQFTASITEMNVTGNYADVLGRLVEVGNDPVPWTSFKTPTTVFEGVQFSGL